MNSDERRLEIKKILESSESAVSATALARQLGVSRQIIVGDVALIRAAGCDIDATARGYVLRTNNEYASGRRYQVVCQHSRLETEQELMIMVDNGCRVIDVIIDHPVYGQLTGSLDISSRYDIKKFMQRISEHEAHSLSELTDGIHIHTIEYPDEGTLERTLKELKEAGLIYED